MEKNKRTNTTILCGHSGYEGQYDAYCSAFYIYTGTTGDAAHTESVFML